MRRATLTAVVFMALALAGCTGADPYVGYRTDAPTFDTMVRREYADARGLAYDCVRAFGTLTRDHRACLVAKWRVCFYLTLREDRRHDRELTARCNGWDMPFEFN